HPSVRNGRALPASRLTPDHVNLWKRNDSPILLLKIPKAAELPSPVRQYLQTDAARDAQTAYKCRVRDPWYSVPDVRIPDYFLTICRVLSRAWSAMTRNARARTRCMVCISIALTRNSTWPHGDPSSCSLVANLKGILWAAACSSLNPARRRRSCCL